MTCRDCKFYKRRCMDRFRGMPCRGFRKEEKVNLMKNSPCFQCSDRDGLECKKYCKKWEKFEEKKKRTYDARVKKGRETSAAVVSRIRAMKKR